MEDSKTAFLLIAAIVLLAFTFAMVMIKSDYEKACIETGGKAVYNGRNYECFKEAKQ